MKLSLEKNEEFIDILKLIAPGTEIRQGLENILKSKT
jgi:diadenylate cyclase